MRSKKKNVVVYAYTVGNFGDDLFVKILLSRYPHSNFHLMLSDEFQSAFKDCKNVNMPSSFVFFIKRIFQKLGICDIRKKIFGNIDANIVIGGSIFMQSKEWEKNRIKLDLREKTYFIGCNFGPYYTEEFFNYYRELYKNVEDVCFRDKYSFQLFCDNSKVRYAPDIVFCYDDVPEKEDGKFIGISVIDLSFRSSLFDSHNEYIERLAEICNAFIDKGEKIILFSFCEYENDGRAIKDVLKYIKKNDCVMVVKYDGNINAFIKSLNTCKLILASRFHAMIIGWKLKKIVYPIIYNKKQRNILEDINHLDYYWDLHENISKPASEIIEETGKIDILNINDLVIRANEQFLKLDLLLK